MSGSKVWTNLINPRRFSVRFQLVQVQKSGGLDRIRTDGALLRTDNLGPKIRFSLANLNLDTVCRVPPLRLLCRYFCLNFRQNPERRFYLGEPQSVVQFSEGSSKHL
jgi:hypothetical protein